MSNLALYGLSEETIAKITTLFQFHPHIERAIIYGSRAKGNFKKGSDIDLTLVGDKLDYNDLVQIATKIDDLLLPYQVDLSLFHQISNPELLDHIKRCGKDFYFCDKKP